MELATGQLAPFDFQVFYKRSLMSAGLAWVRRMRQEGAVVRIGATQQQAREICHCVSTSAMSIVVPCASKRGWRETCLLGAMFVSSAKSNVS